MKVAPILNCNLGTLEGQCESNYMLKSEPGDTARVEIAVRVCDQFNNEEYHALNILRNIVSNTMSFHRIAAIGGKLGRRPERGTSTGLR